jgi:hypothetical protein
MRIIYMQQTYRKEVLRIAKVNLMRDGDNKTFHHRFFRSDYVMYGE